MSPLIFIFVLTLLGTHCNVEATQRPCKQFEMEVQCNNPCPPTCEMPNRRPCPTFACMRGCSCRPGYLRNKSGKCVLRSQC